MQLLTKTVHEVMKACQVRPVSGADNRRYSRQGSADEISIFMASYGAETARKLTAVAQYHREVRGARMRMSCDKWCNAAP